jgi:hypothetical protein
VEVLKSVQIFDISDFESKAESFTDGIDRDVTESEIRFYPVN